jgi:hypothetical protein
MNNNTFGGGEGWEEREGRDRENARLFGCQKQKD